MKANLQPSEQEPSSGSTVGLDLGDRWSRYCVLDGKGTVIEEDRVRTSAEALEQRLRPHVLPHGRNRAPKFSMLLDQLVRADETPK